MKKFLYIGIIAGVLSGLLLAAFMTFFKKEALELDKTSMSAFNVQGDLMQPFYITQAMIDKIRGVNQQVNKTNILNNWKLIATYISHASAAMFASGNKVEVLRIGQSLEGYLLKQVDSMSVTFEEKSGKKLVVYMDIAYAPQNNARGGNGGQQGQPAEQTDFKLTRLSVDKYLKSPEELLKNVSVVPKLNGGVFDGVLVNGLTKYSFLYNFGVRKGDVIVGINGKKLNSVNDAIGQYQKLLDSREFQVTVIRDNQEKVLKYEVVN